MSNSGYNGGFFNHYDDPDEFWDEEPPVASPVPRPSTAPPMQEIQHVQTNVTTQPAGRKSGLVEVKCGLDRLPTSILLKRSWKNAFTPSQYGESIMDAYHSAVQELVYQLVESGTVPPPTISTLRDAAPLLLRTRTHEEYTDLYTELFTQSVHEVNGPGYNRYGRPGLIVTAKRSQLISISIDPDWATAVDANYIAQDILDCCARIRARKPEIIRDTQLDQESDRELAARVVRHERTLLQNGI
ncbi:hypothetical protein [Nocardia carnea]|uniref:hypothetical protein n=1 Tax=Nocardia carnea TaxID=37328 RepID=UPI002453A3BD|nr:hypothetical protein [Nocardia carnea]